MEPCRKRLPYHLGSRFASIPRLIERFMTVHGRTELSGSRGRVYPVTSQSHANPGQSTMFRGRAVVTIPSQRSPNPLRTANLPLTSVNHGMNHALINLTAAKMNVFQEYTRKEKVAFCMSNVSYDGKEMNVPYISVHHNKSCTDSHNSLHFL